MKRLTIIVAIFAALTTGCGSEGGASEPGTTAVSRREATGSATAAALEGVWRSGNVTIAEMAATLRAAGLQQWIQPFRANADNLGESNVFTLSIARGRWRQTWSRDGAAFIENDEGRYRIVGDTVVITHATGTDTFRWSVQGDRLTLTFLETRDIPPYEGIPEEVYQRVYYTGMTYTRQG